MTHQYMKSRRCVLAASATRSKLVVVLQRR